MKIKDTLLISLISIITFVFELFFYLIFVVSAASSEDFNVFSWTGMFFISLMIFTASVGLLSPFCAFIGHITKREKVGNIMLIVFLSLIIIFLIISCLIFSKFMQ
ncbi:hypothetical protein ES702_07097 [subsurface metagenome]